MLLRLGISAVEVSEAARPDAAIGSLRPEGSTNAAAGMQLGYAVASEAFREGGINRVILASDGVANVGVTDAAGILDLARGWALDGIQLVTAGFGMGNYNDALMEQLADDGDGFYAYVDDLDEAERLFVHDLTGTLNAVALDARAQVDFDPGTVAAYASSATRTATSQTRTSATTRSRRAPSAQDTR